jgi:D-serine deaminase-like pyridoxal phosphate-dependent protein
VPLHADLETATAGLEPPFAVVDLDAFDANAADLLARARGKPVRLASKSVRCRALIDRALGAGLTGVLAFTLPEALWLAGDHDDVVVAYPTVDRGALRELASGPARERVTVMVDSREHLDLIEAATSPDEFVRAGRDELVRAVRVCIDVDAGWRPLGGRVRIGAKRSPLRTPGQAAALANEIAARPGLELDGLMMYEAQIAGVGDRPGNPLLGVALRAMQRASARELAARRAAVVAALPPLRFVNGGGTGSVAATAAEAVVTEVAAGSGLFAPTLFDAYSSFTPRPAAFFALPVVRHPARRVATVLGGGYPASGPPGRDRLPRPALPTGLRLDRQEGAGEVQTPVLGADLPLGSRVWFRHAKAGELCERFDVLHLVQGDRVVDTVPTYRGEGRTFL